MAIRALLADGQWRLRDEVVAKAGLTIPPGRAMRQREKDAERLRRRPGVSGGPGGSGRRVERSDDFYVAVGRRAIISATLHQLAGMENKQGDDGKRWVRLTRPSPKESHHL